MHIIRALMIWIRWHRVGTSQDIVKSYFSGMWSMHYFDPRFSGIGTPTTYLEPLRSLMEVIHIHCVCVWSWYSSTCNRLSSIRHLAASRSLHKPPQPLMATTTSVFQAWWSPPSACRYLNEDEICRGSGPQTSSVHVIKITIINKKIYMLKMWSFIRLS